MEKLKSLILILQEKISAKFFGKVEISFENGSIVNVRVTQNIKI